MGWFSSSQKAPAINWIQLTDLNQINDLESSSNDKPVLFFKHSTRCSISIMALSRLESDWDLSEDEIIPVYLDLLRYRDISNELADRYNVTHQSPQLILIKNGDALYNTSHNQISVRDLKTKL
jgi:bacillithiol system protein YtxJ